MINSLRVGFFLAIRQIKRSNIWTTVLIIFVMTLTFLNLVVVSGILVGLVEGSSRAFRSQYSGDILVKPQPKYKTIEQGERIISVARSFPEVLSVSGRIIIGAQVASDYDSKPGANEKIDMVSVQLTGVDPEEEASVTNLSKLIIEGRYLSKDNFDQILIGSNLLDQYSRNSLEDSLLKNVRTGSKVKIKIGESIGEYEVAGIIKSKVGDVSQRVFMNKQRLEKILNRKSGSLDEISIKLTSEVEAEHIQKDLQASVQDKSALINTWKEAQGTFFEDLSKTFEILGSVIGAIGLTVASITVFIVIFINAITRRKFIGILKGIGIRGFAIAWSYVIQSIFYATIGTLIGLALLYGVFEPYFAVNPIDFPFSDGILAVTGGDVALKVVLLFVVTIFAGYIPAFLIIRRNTLDSILGR